MENSAENVETIVKYGEGIAKAKFVNRIISNIKYVGEKDE